MADDVTLPLGTPEPDEEPTAPVLTDDALGASEDAGEGVEEPPGAPEPPPISREAQLAAENAQLRSWVMQLEERTRAGQQTPPVPTTAPDPFAHMTPEQQQAWRQSVQTLDPWLRQREEQRQREIQTLVDQRMQQMEQRFSEASQLRAQFPDFAAREAEFVQMQQAAARQGQAFTLGQLYTFVKGQEALQAAQRGGTPRTQATQQRRRATAQAARPESTAPAGVRVPAPAASRERIQAMSDDEILDRMAAQAGIPRLKIQKRAV